MTRNASARASDRPVEVELADGTRIPGRVDSRGQLHMDRERLPPASRGDAFSVAEKFDAAIQGRKPLTTADMARIVDKMHELKEQPQYVVHYRLDGRIGATTPEPAEGAMRDRGVLLGMGAWPVEVVEVKR